MRKMNAYISKCPKSVMLLIVLLIVVLAFVGSRGLAQTSEKEGAQQISSKNVLAAIIKNRELFGRDFPTALASLPAWKRFGERKITVFPGQVAGSTPYRKPKEVEQLTPKLSEYLKTYGLRSAAESTDLLKGISVQQLQVKTVSKFPDDDSVRIVLTNSSVEFLNPKLTVAAVIERIGKPEKIVRQLIQTEKERRPIVLTVYSYADNAIAFAESDISPRPGSVDRVILDVTSVTAALFQEAK